MFSYQDHAKMITMLWVTIVTNGIDTWYEAFHPSNSVWLTGEAFCSLWNHDEACSTLLGHDLLPPNSEWVKRNTDDTINSDDNKAAMVLSSLMITKGWGLVKRSHGFKRALGQRTRLEQHRRSFHGTWLNAGHGCAVNCVKQSKVGQSMLPVDLENLKCVPNRRSSEYQLLQSCWQVEVYGRGFELGEQNKKDKRCMRRKSHFITEKSRGQPRSMGED